MIPVQKVLVRYTVTAGVLEYAVPFALYGTGDVNVSWAAAGDTETQTRLAPLTGLGMYHGLTYGITDFPGIEPHNAPIPFHNCLYHIAFIFQAEKIPASFS